jgi:hypothetical protein
MPLWNSLYAVYKSNMRTLLSAAANFTHISSSTTPQSIIGLHGVQHYMTLGFVNFY